MIGQAAEFDYSGVQACKVLLEEGYEVVLVNSNPATIMTDPEFATATYIEPLTPETVAAVIEKERPDALLGTLGGQTALNLAKALHEDGTLERFGVELIGADYDAIQRAEDRELFRETMIAAGLRVPRSAIVTSMADADRAIDDLGLPLIVRPAFTLGGHGGGIARTPAEFRERVSEGLNASPINQVLLEESLLGWGEFELEVMRDRNDNALVVCSIENIDPMGVHTGDSVTVAPQQTLTDGAYQELRDQALAVIRAVGVETGGSNIQFAVDPADGEVVVIEMNPRVSRSSALASKATGFPIAKIAARLAVGYALEEIPNDITRRTPASFEPTIDYAVVKIPRFAFEKFPLRRGRPHHPDEERGGGDGDRPHVQAGVHEGDALARARRGAATAGGRRRAARRASRCPPTTATSCCSRRCGAGTRSRSCTRAPRSTPGSCASSRSWWRPSATAAKARSRARRTRLLRRARPASRARSGSRPACARPTSPSTPARPSSRPRRPTSTPPTSARSRAATPRERAAPRHEAERRDPGLGPEPDRAGHRVRLLLRARRDDGARAGPRRGDGQLQPGDGFDRLRHLRPASISSR